MSPAQLRYPFVGCENVTHNWSWLGQDLFVLGLLNGRAGTYLDICNNDGEHHNNTVLLEDYFNWTGIAVQENLEMVGEYNIRRNNKSIASDITTADYNTIIADAGLTNIDYLSIRVQPNYRGVDALKKALDSNHRFAIITFSHDTYYNLPDRGPRILSRRLLQERGYVLLVSNVGPGPHADQAADDWWVHPDRIDVSTIEHYKADDDTTTYWHDYIYQ